MRCECGNVSKIGEDRGSGKISVGVCMLPQMATGVAVKSNRRHCISVCQSPVLGIPTYADPDSVALE